jgi:hypothetical protein
MLCAVLLTTPTLADVVMVAGHVISRSVRLVFRVITKTNAVTWPTMLRRSCPPRPAPASLVRHFSCAPSFLHFVHHHCDVTISVGSDIASCSTQRVAVVIRASDAIAGFVPLRARNFSWVVASCAAFPLFLVHALLMEFLTFVEVPSLHPLQ